MELVIRATVIYWFLWLVMRGTGKRSLAELTPLDLMLLIVVGDLVQQGVTQEDMSITGAVVAVAVFVVWTLLADTLAKRKLMMAKVLTGEPVIVVRDGVPLDDRLKRERISLEELQEAARAHGIGDLSEVSFGVLETDGRFSFIRRQDVSS